MEAEEGAESTRCPSEPRRGEALSFPMQRRVSVLRCGPNVTQTMWDKSFFNVNKSFL